MNCPVCNEEMIQKRIPLCRKPQKPRLRIRTTPSHKRFFSNRFMKYRPWDTPVTLSKPKGDPRYNRAPYFFGKKYHRPAGEVIGWTNAEKWTCPNDKNQDHYEYRDAEKRKKENKKLPYFQARKLGLISKKKKPNA